MTTSIEVGSVVRYTNGSPSVRTGKIVSVKGDRFTVIDPDNSADIELWSAGCAIGSYIHVSQIKG